MHASESSRLRAGPHGAPPLSAELDHTYAPLRMRNKAPTRARPMRVRFLAEVGLVYLRVQERQGWIYIFITAGGAPPSAAHVQVNDARLTTTGACTRVVSRTPITDAARVHRTMGAGIPAIRNARSVQCRQLAMYTHLRRAASRNWICSSGCKVERWGERGGDAFHKFEILLYFLYSVVAMTRCPRDTICTIQTTTYRV